MLHDSVRRTSMLCRISNNLCLNQVCRYLRAASATANDRGRKLSKLGPDAETAARYLEV
jgi:hypothetical protein